MASSTPKIVSPRGVRAQLAGWGLALAGSCLFFHRAAFTHDVFIQRDLLRVYYPLRQYWADRVRRFEFPGWYPFEGLGQPFVGITVNGAFHPSNLLQLVLPGGTAITLTILLAYGAALLGMCRLGRRMELSAGESVLGAVAYSFSGYLVCISNNVPYLLAAATLPWVFSQALAGLARRSWSRIAGVSVLLALLVLGGDPQSFYLSAVGILLLALAAEAPWRPRAITAVAMVTGGALLAAVQILPSLEVKREGRGGNSSLQTTMLDSGHPLRGLELLLGPLFVDADRTELLSDEVASGMEPDLGGPWVDAQDLGAGVVVLAAAGLWFQRRRRLARGLGGALVVLGLVWLGRHAFLYPLLYRMAPMWRSFRYPEKVTPLLLLLLCVGAGHGLASLAGQPLALRRRFGIALAVGALGVWALGLAEARAHLFSGGLLPRVWGSLPADQLGQLGRNFQRCALETGGVLGVLALALGWVERRSLRAALVGVAVAANLFVANQGLYWVTSPRVLTEAPTLVQELQAREGALSPGAFRVLSIAGSPPRGRGPRGMAAEDFSSLAHAEALRPDISALFGLETPDAYLPAASARLEALQLRPLEDARLYNTRYLVLTTAQRERSGLPPAALVAAPPRLGLELVRLPGDLDRAYLAEPRCVPDEAAAIAALHSARFEAGKEAVVECGAWRPPPPSPMEAPRGKVELVGYRPERVELEVGATRPSWLVLNDAFYSGWSATVDGVHAEILPTNVAVRGVFVPAGHHSVIFGYRAPGVRWGAGLSGLTALLLGALVLRERRGSR